MSKISIGEDEYETADLLAYQQFSLWLYEVVLDAVNGRFGSGFSNDTSGAM